MSYCVHCGVEMAPSEPNCPLCGTEVINPNAPWVTPQKMPYPDRIEETMRHIDRRYGRKLAVLIMLIPTLVVTAVNLLSNGTVSWAIYVIGSLICFYCWLIVPFFFSFKKPYIYLLVDFAALIFLLFLIAVMGGSMVWFWQLALPIVALLGATVMLGILAVRRLEWQPLIRASVICILLALLLVALDFVIDLYAGAVYLNWSIYAGLPLLVLSAIFAVLEKKRGLKQSILKRLFI